MEIKDYLRVLGKRAWLLVMIPAVAGVVAGLIAVGQPQAFRTTATLQLPRDETTTPAQVAQLVADFQAAADNPTVQNQVSSTTGVPVRRIQRVRITQVGDSSQLTMSFQDKRKDATDAKAVINGLAATALDDLQTPELRNAQRAIDTANDRIEQTQADIDEAVAQRNEIFNQVQSSSPEEDLNITRDERSNYNQELVKARLAGSAAAITLYDELVKQADQRIIALSQAVQDVALINQQIAVHEDALATATEERDAALQLQSVTDTTPTPVFSAEGQSVVRKTRVVKTAAAAVVAGFPIAIGVVLLLDAAQKRRARRPVRREDDEEFAGAAEDELELEAAPTSPVSPSPALIGATPGPAGLPAGSAVAVAEDEAEVDEDDLDDEYDEYEDDVEDEDETEEAQELHEAEELDEGEAVIVDGIVVEEDIDDELEDIEDELIDDEEDAEDDAQAEAVHDAEVLHELDEADLDAAELDEADLDEADLDEAELDELALAGLDDSELDDDDLDEADLGDDLDEELEDDVAATVASRRRLYDADIDDDLSLDGGSTEHNAQHHGPQHNGVGRVWARVPAADADFDGDDEAGADR